MAMVRITSPRKSGVWYLTRLKRLTAGGATEQAKIFTYITESACNLITMHDKNKRKITIVTIPVTREKGGLREDRNHQAACRYGLSFPDRPRRGPHP